MEDNNLKNNQEQDVKPTVEPKDNDVNPKDDKGESKTGDVVSKLKERLNKKTAENSSLADQVADLRRNYKSLLNKTRLMMNKQAS